MSAPNAAAATAAQNWGAGGFIVDSKGQPMTSSGVAASANTGGGGGGAHIADIAGLKKNVGFLNWVAAGGAAALIALYLLLSAQIETRFDKQDGKELSQQVGDLRVALAGQGVGIQTLLKKSDTPKSSVKSSQKLGD